MDRETIEKEIADLEARVKARRGKPGFGENVRAIDARLAELREALNGD